MSKILMLDCTLRDGGYINDWQFGKEAIFDIEKKLVSTGVDIVEIGFLKNEIYNPNRTVFSDEKQIEDIIAPKNKDVLYAAMVEVMNPLPIEYISQRTDTSIDIIRVIVWKRLLKEGFEYCKAITEKGYKVCVQPARVDQYSQQEFVEMVELFNNLNPMAVYIVDSWGTQDKEGILRYIELADKHLKKDIALGFHGHNNLQQAFGCAEAFAELGLKRDIIIDASIYGIGRGAGNLNLEIFARYLNIKFDKNYDITPMLKIYSDYIEKIYKEHPWGYSFPNYLVASYNCNPEYADYYGFKKKLSLKAISDIISKLKDTDKIIFTKDTADSYLEKYLKTRK
ncbi:aldolase catalytic domain-containing protein [Clostridium tagluense]|uniref:aldolase catalytic domain-containing protein n=1 Tax=Clostridium tagluense TaxID=360422 RepID=UPI001CF52A8C|nr:aldolase catalytic domain-containing protein [Clostridium tagluense]MCB2296791.1 aldolase catalytic domain-containing protein [Clostridium tagluense]